MNRLFYSLISLFIALFFLMLGILCLMLPWSPSARTDLISLILENSTSIAIFGMGLLLIGLIIAINIALGARHSYYKVRTGPRSVQVDENILQSYLDSYWRQTFPTTEIPHRFTLKRNKIQITADLPYIPQNEQKALLTRLSAELAEIFENFLGYRQSLSLSASFQPEAKK